MVEGSEGISPPARVGRKTLPRTQAQCERISGRAPDARVTVHPTIGDGVPATASGGANMRVVATGAVTAGWSST